VNLQVELTLIRVPGILRRVD